MKEFLRERPTRRGIVQIEKMIDGMACRIEKINKKHEEDINGLLNELRDFGGQYAEEYGQTESRLGQLEKTLQQLDERQSQLNRILSLCRHEDSPVSVSGDSREQDYIHMQKVAYNDANVLPEDIVGQYAWHEEYPYETFLLYRNGDIRKPLFETMNDKTALDFACGPGRMVRRMQKLFRKVDGCDISERLIAEARKRVPDTDFYVTNGNDLGDVPEEFYDFIYCTISMQHIASHKIRMSILQSMHSALKSGGKITLQMAYNPDFPYVTETSRMEINGKQIRVYQKEAMASWFADDFFAETTNGGHDVGIGKADLDAVKADFSNVFSNVSVWFGNVADYYDNLEGKKHGSYWATDWIYVYGEKH